MSSLILPMSTVTNIVTHQVRINADQRVTREPICTAKCLRVLESRNDKGEPVTLCSPTICVISQGDKIRPGDDEPLGTNRGRLGITGDVSLATRIY